MIDTPLNLDCLRILPEILKFRFSLHMVKDDRPPSPSWLPRILPEILKFRFSVHMVKVKDDWPPFPSWLPRISPEILKFRFSVHIVKDDGPPLSFLTAQHFTRNFKV